MKLIHIIQIENIFQNITLQNSIIGYSSLEEALDGMKIIVLAVPTKAIREVLGKINEFQKNALHCSCK